MAEKINDGGPAYPHCFEDMSGHSHWRLSQGMSLRDWYRGQALAGLCANPGGPFQANATNGWDIVNCTADHVAKWCDELADAMLAIDADTTRSSNMRAEG